MADTQTQPSPSPKDIQVAKQSATTLSSPSPTATPNYFNSAGSNIYVICGQLGSKKGDASEAKCGFIQITTAISPVISSIAWPLAALIIALIFRKELTKLLARLRKGKIGNSEWEFDSLLNEAESEAPETVRQHTVAIDSATITLAASQPRAAVITAWLQIERLMDEILERRGFYQGRRNSISAIKELQKSELIPGEYIALLHDLRVLRNQAAHSDDFTPSADSVLKYLELAADVTSELRTVIDKLKSGQQTDAAHP